MGQIKFKIKKIHPLLIKITIPLAQRSQKIKKESSTKKRRTVKFVAVDWLKIHLVFGGRVKLSHRKHHFLSVSQ